MLRCERSEPRPFEARLRRAPQGEERGMVRRAPQGEDNV